MPSIAEKVALDLVGNVGKSVTQLALKHGASPTYADNGNIQKTKSFQAVMEKWRATTTKQLQKKVKKSLDYLDEDKLAKTSARDLMSIVDTGIKNTQLLTGGSTSNVAVAGVDIFVRE